MNSSFNIHNNNGFTRTISITSGKGGVGKTTLVSNMAHCLAQQGHKVLILDGDLGMANIDIMFGVYPKYLINDVLEGQKTLKEIIIEIEKNIFLIPGGSGVYSLQNLRLDQKSMLLEQVSRLEGLYDFMLIDTAPGISDNVLYLNSAAQDILLVVTPDPASLADTYALIKVLHQKQKEKKFSIVCNNVRDEAEALRLFKRLSDVAARFLCVSLDYKGHIPIDRDLRKATKSQQLIMKQNPRSPSSFAIREVSKKLSGLEYIGEAKGGLQFFWQQLSGII